MYTCEIGTFGCKLLTVYYVKHWCCINTFNKPLIPKKIFKWSDLFFYICIFHMLYMVLRYVVISYEVHFFQQKKVLII